MDPINRSTNQIINQGGPGNQIGHEHSRFSPALTAFFCSSFCFTRSIHSLREVEGRMCSIRTLIFFLMILPFTCG